ncbi:MULTISPECIES: FliM/FliN family flagellar motor switch protein [unclassified Dickeya]|uniref:FliM/FliN family flagellar motor switch protein n=1 Tax=unclassified Dickeya TaxID=2622466 RepID=UPI000399F9D9|nr:MULTISPECIES: FliM/FliN family flagellar motor switch protein [unclassified Dickeya]
MTAQGCTRFTPRPVSLAQARASRQLAMPQRFAFQVDNEPGELRLQLAPVARPIAQETIGSWHCQAGAFWLEHAGPLLSLLSACPAIEPLPAVDAQDWHGYWMLYNHYLSPQLRDWLGEIRPAPPQEQGHTIPDNALALWLSVVCGDRHFSARLWVGAGTLQVWLAHPGWQRTYAALPDYLAIRVPLTLAEVTLSLEQWAAREPGDVICPLKLYFSVAGTGSVTLAGWRLSGQLTVDGLAPYRFTVTELEECPVTTVFDDPSPFADSPPVEEPRVLADAGYPAAATDAGLGGPHHTLANGYASALPPLSLALTVRCGYLTLTLQDLQQLAPGSVLTLQQAVPGEATLYHGEQALAHGELVDVAGRLGLQITHCLNTPTAAPPLEPAP